MGILNVECVAECSRHQYFLSARAAEIKNTNMAKLNQTVLIFVKFDRMEKDMDEVYTVYNKLRLQCQVHKGTKFLNLTNIYCSNWVLRSTKIYL